MVSESHKISRSPEHNTVNSLQVLQSIVKWHHMEHVATSLWDAYSGILSHQAMILSINSSFVDPVLQFETQLQIIHSCFKTVFAIPSLEEVKEMGRSTDNNDNDHEDLKNLYYSILNIYKNTILVLVSEDLYKLQILKEMIVWMSEESSYLKERVLVVISSVLSFMSKKVKKYVSVDVPCLGVLAAELSLLCFHTDPSITHQAALGMCHLLCIAQCQNVDIVQNKGESHSFLPSQSDTEFLPIILKDKTNIAQRVGQVLLPSLLTDFVWSLLLKLSVPCYTTAHDAADILTLTLEYHANKVIMVSKIVDTIYMQLCENSSYLMEQAMLRIIALLTRTSPKKVIFQLMEYPIPADIPLILMWQAAGSEPSVAPHVLKTILLILKGKTGEKQDNLTDRRRFSLDVTNMMPVAASQALSMLLSIGSYKKAVAQFFPQLLMSLMFQLFYSHDDVRLMTNDRLLYARDALRVLLNCSGLQEVDIALKRKNCWDEFSQGLLDHRGVYLIARTLSNYKFPQFPETLHYLYKLSVQGPRRTEDSVITVIFLTELLNNFFKDPFPEEFLVLFRNWVNDSNPAVSKLSLQKIASMAPVINQVENVCSFLLAILHVFLSKDKTVVCQALVTLRILLSKLDKVTYSSICTRIASSYCPLMDHSNGGIRSMAIRHLGELLKDMSQYSWMLNPVVLKGLVPLILFLEDTDMRVVKACKYTLATCVSELHWSPTFMLKDHCHNFEQVVLNLCNNVLISHGSDITDLIADTLGFLESSQTHLRRASVILIGYLATLSGHLLLKDELQVMSEAIEPLLRDKDPVIRDLTETTYTLFKKVAHKLTSSSVKQAFRRVFNFIYMRKLKPLYKYNWTNDLTDIPAEIKETKSDKEGFMCEKDEDISGKNETPSRALEYNSEEE